MDSILKDASLCSFVMMPTSLPGPLSGSDSKKLNPDRMVRDLIELGLDPNEPCPDGGLPLHVAIFVGNREMIDLLSELGGDVNAEDPDSGFNAVVHAIILTDLELVNYLESRGGTIEEDVRVSATKALMGSHRLEKASGRKYDPDRGANPK